MKLYDKDCKNAKPKDKTYKLYDGGGLYLEVTTKGSKLWRLKYRFLNKEKKLSIGAYPIISLADARQARVDAKKLITQGIDPSTHKQAKKKERIKERANTFEVIAREWYDIQLPEWSETNAKTIIGRLEKDVFPMLGKHPVRDITHQMILDAALKVKERGANELAKRIIQMCRHIFKYAVITGRADRNIAEDLKGVIKSKPVKHYAAIDSKDIPQFMADLESHKHRLKHQTYLALKFMMLTFMRTREMIEAQWDEFDFVEKVWIVPAHRMKMKKEHLVPLSDQAIAILNELRNIHHNPIYVFPSRINSRKTMSNNTVLMVLRRMGYQGVMTGHGFRSLAMSTIMERLGYRHEIPDAQLAHAKKGDVNRAYDRAKFIDDRKVMMQEWADYIDSVSHSGVVLNGDFAKTM